MYLIRSTLHTARSNKMVRYPNGLHYRDRDDITTIKWYISEKVGDSFYDIVGYFDTEDLAKAAIALQSSIAIDLTQ